jgi:hypothetical protein
LRWTVFSVGFIDFSAAEELYSVKTAKTVEGELKHQSREGRPPLHPLRTELEWVFR